MKRLIPALLSLVILFSACEKDEDNQDNQTLENGLYRGTFSRTGMDTVNVSISVLQGNFEGQSERQSYPAICRGSFTRDNSSITFSDSCTWQANFDWTLILNGNYQLSENGTRVRVWRTNGASTDEYLLIRQVR
jgi:hypothetical protein